MKKWQVGFEEGKRLALALTLPGSVSTVYCGAGLRLLSLLQFMGTELKWKGPRNSWAWAELGEKWPPGCSPLG